MTIELRATALEPAVFAPFGQVIGAGLRDAKAANQGTAVRFDRSADLQNLRDDASANLAVFRSTPVSLPFRVRLLEKHPRSTQLFAPMRVARYLVMVAPTLTSGAPDVRALRVFEAGPGLGVNYAPGVWHHPILALDAPAEFLMLAWENGSPDDCVEHWFDPSLELFVVG